MNNNIQEIIESLENSANIIEAKSIAILTQSNDYYAHHIAKKIEFQSKDQLKLISALKELLKNESL